MSLRSLGRWALLLAVGCDGKLVVDRGDNSASDAGTVIPSDAGKIGETCLPEGLLTESEGNSAEAVIQVLARCDAGLSCNAQGKCTAAPDCPQSQGVCVVRRATFDQSSYESEDFLVLTGIVALAASDTHVYWLEYGTRDPRGNYQHDGALMSYGITDGTTTTVASGLDGPTTLGLTTTHAYIVADGVQHNTPELLRVPLTGGSVELLQQGKVAVLFTGFAAAGSQAFWGRSNSIYTMSADSNAVPTLFFSPESASLYLLASDGTDLFYNYSSGLDSGALKRTPIASASPTPTDDWLGFSTLGVAPHGDELFELETLLNGTPSSRATHQNGTAPPSPSGVLLMRAPKSGGEFQQVRPLGAGAPTFGSDETALQAIGDRYFFAVHDWVPDRDGNFYYQKRVLSAGFADNDPPIRLLELPEQRPVNRFHWTGTAVGLFWSDGRAIYEQPLPNP
jgi:hypothetical protein